MAEPQIPVPTTTTNPPDNGATRNDSRDMLGLARGRLSVGEHGEQLASQACIAEAEHKVATLTTQLAELQTTASKAALTDADRQHSFAVLDHQQNQWWSRTNLTWQLEDARKERDRKLAEDERVRAATADDARRERDRKLAEDERVCAAARDEEKRERDRLEEAQRVRDVATAAAEREAEARQRNAAIISEINTKREAIAIYENRTTTISVLMGGGIGVFSGLLYRSTQSTRTKRAKRTKAQPSNLGLMGVGGVVTTLAPLLVQQVMRQAAELPAPATGAGLEAHNTALILESCRLDARLILARHRKVSLPVGAVAAVGSFLLVCAIPS